MKRVSSLEFLPPNFSELRVAVLGNNWKKSCSVGNLILEEEKFNTEEEPGRFLRARIERQDKALFLIIIPDFLQLTISDTEIQEQLSDLDPHVFLLVLHIDTFTEEYGLRLSRILQLFSDDSFEHSLILMSSQREVGSDENYRCHTHLYNMVKLCKYRYLREKNFEREELIVRLGQTAKKKSSDVIEEQDAGLLMKPSSRHDRLNLFLYGRREEDKTLAAKAILCQTELRPTSISPVCVQHNGTVAGCWVSLVTFSSVYGKPLELVMKESLRSMSRCDPDGVHAFILVLPTVPLTDEDKEELETIQNIFGPEVTDFTMIMAVEDDSKELWESSGDRHVVVYMRDQQQISEMLEDMTNKGSFTRDMFTQAQINKVVDQEKNIKVKAELEDVRQRCQIEEDVKDLSREPLRMILTGKKGCGKSTTAGTILGKKFSKKSSFSRGNRAESGMIEGRPVSLVTTASLSSSAKTQSEIKQELHKCIRLLAPGPHVFLLVMQIGNIDAEEKNSLDLIKNAFGKEAERFTFILFTAADKLGNQSFESYIKHEDDFIQQLIQDCGGRYHVLNNHNTNFEEVQELWTKIDLMLKQNGGSCYKMSDSSEEEKQTTLENISEIKEAIKNMERKHMDESQTMREKISELTKEVKQKEKQLREECDKRKHRKTWEIKEAELLKEQKNKMVVRKEREQRESTEKKLRECQRELKKDRETWDKEKKELWEQKSLYLEKQLDEEKTRYNQLYQHYRNNQRVWKGSLMVMVVAFLYLLYYIFQLIFYYANQYVRKSATEEDL
ncbi:GTPase IMAP family member 8-like isoform X2 [Cynoglossus semilaevis]|nr:GTPase IMAP family member 8-like isoform X2 [Cynoglossus semilaevis]